MAWTLPRSRGRETRVPVLQQGRAGTDEHGRSAVLHGWQQLPRQERSAPLAQHKALVTSPYPYTDLLSFDATWARTQAAAWWYGTKREDKEKHAQAQFNKPLVVGHLSDLKARTAANDGVVFVHGPWTRGQVMALMDITRDCRLYSALGVVMLHAGVPRIFCVPQDLKLTRQEQSRGGPVHRLDFDEWAARA